MPCSSHSGPLAFRSALIAFACLAHVACGSRDNAAKSPAGPPTGAESVAARRHIQTDGVPSFVHASMAYCQEEMARWSQCRAYEKLRVAELLVPLLSSTEKCEEAAGPEWKHGGNGLSRVAGRAKWCFERLLGVELADLSQDPSPEELSKLRAQGSRLVEAYRSGIVALAADRPVPPEQLLHLRRKYRWNIVPDESKHAWDCIWAMEALLGEWPPIGRKYEDFVAIIGAEGESADQIEKGAIRYRLDTGQFGVDYFFVVRQGIIRSVWRVTFS